MKTKILTGLAALSLLIGVVSTQGCYDGGGWGGSGYGGGYSTYAAGPSYYGPAFVGHPYAYDYRGFGHDGHEFAGGHGVFHGAAHVDGGHAVAHSVHGGGSSHRG